MRYSHFSDAVLDLLRLGELLEQSSPQTPMGIPRRMTGEEHREFLSKVEPMEKDLAQRANDKSAPDLRRMLALKRDERADKILLRCLAYVSWETVARGRNGTVAMVAKTVCLGSHEDLMLARHAIRQEIIHGDRIVYLEEFGEGQLEPGKSLIRFLSGKDRLEIVWTGESIEREKMEFRRKYGRAIASSVSNRNRARNVHPKQPAGGITPDDGGLHSPKAIYQAMRKEVIGLDGPLTKFACQAGLHMRMIERLRLGETPKEPIVTLVIGASSAGKSYLVGTFAKLAGLPYSHADASAISQSSYVGLSVEDCFIPLLSRAKSKGRDRIEEAQRGIVVLDEFDKLARQGSTRHGHVDPQGYGVQSELLRPLEGCRLQLGGRRSNDPPLGVIDTSQTCFILSGAFHGLRETLVEMQKGQTPIGFTSSSSHHVESTISDALIEYGMMDQVVGRITGGVIILPDPSQEMLHEILMHPNGLLARQNSLLGSFGLSLSLTRHAASELAGWASETGVYARGIKRILRTLPVVEEALFEGRQGQILVGVDEVRRGMGRSDAEGLVA